MSSVQKSGNVTTEEKNTQQSSKSKAEDQPKASSYCLYNQMDEVNKKAMDVWEEDGMQAAVKHMFTDQKTGRQLSYAEMRSLYG